MYLQETIHHTFQCIYIYNHIPQNKSLCLRPWVLVHPTQHTTELASSAPQQAASDFEMVKHMATKASFLPTTRMAVPQLTPITSVQQVPVPLGEKLWAEIIHQHSPETC